jgi:arylsulfatase A-like enzyme
MRTVCILMDSLNRQMLPAYGNDWVMTPNFDRLARAGVVFDNHYCGSMPCIPAGRDLLTGRINFLETRWGPLEPWDDTLPAIIREQLGTYSHMITDHCHYFNGGAGSRNKNTPTHPCNV